MADVNPEKPEEIERIDAKEQVLDRLVLLAEVKILEASTTAEVQEAIYEILFFKLALFQLEGTKLRLLGKESEVGQHGGWAVESQRALEAIYKGDWRMAKDEARVDVLGALQESYYVPADVLMTDFLHEKIAFVPDKTEPYQHPNLEILKAQLASI